MLRNNIDILLLQETHLTDNATEIKQQHTWYFSGNNEGNREHDIMGPYPLGHDEQQPEILADGEQENRDNLIENCKQLNLHIKQTSFQKPPQQKVTYKKIIAGELYTNRAPPFDTTIR